MKTIFKKIAAGLVLSSVLLPAQAQEFRTSYFMQTSNFRHQMNPAFIDAPYVSFPFMGNINVGATGNVGYKNFIYKLEGNPLYDQTTFMSPTVSASDFLGGLYDKNRADVYVNYNLFSVGFRGFKGMNVVELNLRSNTNITLPYELFEFMKTAGEKEFYQLHDIGARSQNYMELALGHSHRINDRLTVGAKAKFLFGVAYADFKVNQLNLTMNGDEWRVQGDARLKASVLKSEFDYEGPEKNAPDGRRRVKGLDDVSFGMPGFGMAFDLGASYKVMDDLTVSAVSPTSASSVGERPSRHLLLATTPSVVSTTSMPVQTTRATTSSATSLKTSATTSKRCSPFMMTAKRAQRRPWPPRLTSVLNTRCRCTVASISASSTPAAFMVSILTTRPCSQPPSARSTPLKFRSIPRLAEQVALLVPPSA